MSAVENISAIPKLRACGCLLLGMLSGCAPTSNAGAPTFVPIEQVFMHADRYDGKTVQVAACLNATRHGMALVACNGNSTQVEFEETKGFEADFKRILDLGFNNLDKDPVRLRVSLEGVYHRKSEAGHAWHALDVRSVSLAEVR